MGFLVKGAPRKRRRLHIKESDYHYLGEQLWRRPERENLDFLDEKIDKNKCLLITEADPKCNPWMKFQSDHPTLLCSTCHTSLYGVACRDSFSLPLFYETSRKFAYRHFSICRRITHPPLSLTLSNLSSRTTTATKKKAAILSMRRSRHSRRKK